MKRNPRLRGCLRGCLILLGAIVICAAATSLAVYLRFRGQPAELPPAPAAEFWSGYVYDGRYAVEVDVPDALVDQPLAIRVTGLRAQQPALVRARLTDSANQRWESFAAFRAGDSGVVDLPTAAPLAGTYTEADGMGLFWSMVPVGAMHAESTMLEWTDMSQPLRVTLTAEANGKELARIEVIRRFTLDATRVTRRPIDAAATGLVGTLFVPADGKPHPAVLVLGGSEGGLQESNAALLAAHGYSALALAYFGIDPLPRDLMSIPLEYFEKALAWLKTQPGVDPERIAVMGLSKGGELTLLLAATYPQDFKAAVAYVPSHVVWAGIPGADSRSQPSASWSRGGRPLPFVPYVLASDGIPSLGANGVTLRSTYAAGLKDQAAVDAAAIPVENINGPVLLITGGADEMWPSGPMADLVIARLKAKGHAFEDRHLSYPAAGHLILFPYLPTSITSTGVLALGGDARENAAAAADSWPQVLKLLGSRLGGP